MAVFKSQKKSVALDRVPGNCDNNKNVSLTGYSNKVQDASKNNTSIRSKSRTSRLPINKTGILSYIFVTWFSPLVWEMFRKRDKQVEEKDIWQCSKEEGVKHNKEMVMSIWKKEIDKHGVKRASFYRVWIHFIRKRVLINSVTMLVYAVSSFLSSAHLVNMILSYLESADDDIWYGIGLTVAILASEAIRACSYSTLMLFGAQTGARFRSGMNGMVYDKLLKLRTLKGTTSSQILNAFSVDSSRLHIGTMYVSLLLSAPAWLIIGTVYFYILIGYWCSVAIGAFVMCYLLQTYFASKLKHFRKQCVQHTDMRVKRMGETLNIMRFIKMYAWEQPFKDTIEGYRKSEQQYLLYSAIMNALNSSIIFMTPTISSVITISVYVAAGNSLTTPTTFAVIGTMNFLRAIIAHVPAAMRAFGEAQISLDRVKGMLVGICGAVGAGKSSLMSAISGRMHMVNGQVAVNGSVAFVAQHASIFNGTLKENILFGLEYDEQRYTRVISSCGLVIDIQLLEGGDETETMMRQLLQELSHLGLHYLQIGERGINLSGGQKMRVSLARAVYSNSDIYILDDPMSALDVKVGKQVFHDCIKETLKDKTVLLVTHQLQICQHQNHSTFWDRALASAWDNYMKRFEYYIAASGDTKDEQKRVLLPHLEGDEVQDIYETFSDVGNTCKNTKDKVTEYFQRNKNVSFERHIFILACKKPEETVDNLKPQITYEQRYLDQCDVVVVLEDGQIIEKGRHGELLNDDNGVFSQMYRIYESTTITSKDNNGHSDENTRGESHSSFAIEEKDAKIDEKPAEGMGLNTSQNCTETKKTGKLVEAEEMEVGAVRFSTYNAYIKAAGGWFIVCVVSAMYAIANASVVFSDWWLSEWLDTMSGNSTMAVIYLMQSNATTDAHPYPTDMRLGSTTMDSDTYLRVYVITLGGIAFLQFVKGYLGAKVSIKASNNLHSTCLDKVMGAPMSFFDANPVGRILNRFSKDLDESDVFIPLTTDLLLQLLCLVVLTSAMAIYITPWILIAIAPICFVFFLIKYISAISLRKLKRLENVVRSPLISHVNVTSQSLTTITAYGQQKTFYEKCIRHADDASLTVFLCEVCIRWAELRIQLVAGCITAVTSLIFILTKGLLSVSSAGLVFSLCGKTTYSVRALLTLMNSAELHFTSVERLHEYRKVRKSLPSETQHGTETEPSCWPTEGAVEFRDVVMRYRPQLDPVLRSVSFCIRPCENIGVVGRTGAGKSSLVMCLLRLVELSDGNILVDGHDISKLSLNCIRSGISTIPQDPVLFNGSMRKNIDPFAVYSDVEIWNALEKVHMKERIRQFGGNIDGMIEANGDNFSVGEKQLLCLARAILRRNKILLLDEATANIDTSTDTVLQETIRTSFADCTVITIAHRLNTVLHHDKIMVMDAGKIVEFGPPADLLADANSFFNKMTDAQYLETATPPKENC